MMTPILSLLPLILLPTLIVSRWTLHTDPGPPIMKLLDDEEAGVFSEFTQGDCIEFQAGEGRSTARFPTYFYQLLRVEWIKTSSSDRTEQRVPDGTVLDDLDEYVINGIGGYDIFKRKSIGPRRGCAEGTEELIYESETAASPKVSKTSKKGKKKHKEERECAAEKGREKVWDLKKTDGKMGVKDLYLPPHTKEAKRIKRIKQGNCIELGEDPDSATYSYRLMGTLWTKMEATASSEISSAAAALVLEKSRVKDVEVVMDLNCFAKPNGGLDVWLTEGADSNCEGGVSHPIFPLKTGKKAYIEYNDEIEYDELLANYYYDAAKEEAIQKRALSRLAREKAAILRLKKKKNKYPAHSSSSS